MNEHVINRYYQVTSEIKVFSSVNLLAAITFQGYDPVTGLGTLEYTTSLQYPFKLTDVINLIVSIIYR